MKKTLIVLVLIVGLVFSWAIFQRIRYSLIPCAAEPGFAAYKIDHLTGKTQFCVMGENWKEIQEQNPASLSVKRIRQLTNEEISNLCGSGKPFTGTSGTDYFSGTIYNGNKNVAIVSVTMSLGMKEENKPERQFDYTFTQNPPVAPLTVAKIFFDVEFWGMPENFTTAHVSSATGYDIEE